MGRGLTGGQIMPKYDSNDKMATEINNLNRKIDDYKEIIKKRELQIRAQLHEIKDTKQQKNTVINRLNVRLPL